MFFSVFLLHTHQTHLKFVAISVNSHTCSKSDISDDEMNYCLNELLNPC